MTNLFDIISDRESLQFKYGANVAVAYYENSNIFIDLIYINQKSVGIDRLIASPIQNFDEREYFMAILQTDVEYEFENKFKNTSETKTVTIVTFKLDYA